MSIVQRTVEAFPRGRTTEELVVLLGAAFDEAKRKAIVAELQVLAQTGVIRLERNGRWKPAVAPKPRESVSAAGGSPPSSAGAEENLLFAVPARFTQEPLPQEPDTGEDGVAAAVDPHALLRYWRSALRSDPRGAISQAPDRHGSQWMLATGSGPLRPDDGSRCVLTFDLESLPAEFRQALLRREANEMTLAVGWPIMVGRKSGVPVVWPVGLLAAEWSRSDRTLRVSIEADDVLVNPEWLDGAARTAGWQKSELSEIFAATDGVGLRTEDFLNRLREAAARHLRGRITGQQLASQIDLSSAGIYDIAALLLPTESTFTAGAVRDLDTIGTWPVERLARTALGPVLGLEVQPASSVPPDVNVGTLNGEQIEAVRHACTAPLTVVTGPPGTGKSQAIVSMAASVLLNGGNVLVASKNHQALDAVEDRLGGLAPDLPFLIRTLDPEREVDRSVDQVLADMLNETGLRLRPVDPQLAAQAASLSADRRRTMSTIRRRAELECDIAGLVERIAARERFAAGDDRPADEVPERLNFPARLWKFIAGRFRKSGNQPVQNSPDLLPEGAPLAALRARLADLRRERDGLPSEADPVRQTAEIMDLVVSILPSALSERVALREEERQALDAARADYQFHGDRVLPSELTRAVLRHRPLWLASVLGTPKRIPLDDGLFDLVIFDEASQCDIASALPLFARAKRAVVVGDDRQLSFIPLLGQAQDRNLMKAQGLPSVGMGRFAQTRSA